MYDYTSERFEGIFAVIMPEESWAVRWNQMGNRVPGLYALHVLGTAPEYEDESD